MQGKIALEEHFAPPADYDKRLVYEGSRMPNWPEFVRRHDFTNAGDFPVNTSGGQLSVGQAGAAKLSGASIDAVKISDIQDIAQTFLKPENMALTIVGPAGTEKFTRGDLVC